MKSKKRPALDFTSITTDGFVPKVESVDAPSAPPFREAELEIVEVPGAEVTAEPFAARPPPAPVEAPLAHAEPPMTPMVRPTPVKVKESGGAMVWVLACLATAAWPLALVAFAFGYRRQLEPLPTDPFVLIVFGLMAVGPLVLIWLVAYLSRQGQKLGVEIRRTRVLADTMAGPATLALQDAGAGVTAINQQITQAASMAAEARDTMLALRQALAEETGRLAEAAAAADRTAQSLAESLGRQREALEALSGELDSRSAAVSDTITMQARMVADASDLAETQLREAEAALAARAADLAAAAGEAGDAARVAGEDLARQVARLETAGVGVGDQMRIVEAGLNEQRAALVTVAHAIRADQEDFAAQAETRAAQLSEFMAEATVAASSLGEKAASGGEALQSLLTDAAAQMQALLETAQSERLALVGEAQKALSHVSDAAAAERARLEREMREAIDRLTRSGEAAREAAEAHAEAARGRVDQLNEAAFAAHQKADAIFQARLDEARDLIESSAQMVEQAGAAAAQRLDVSAGAAKATLTELQALMDELETKTRRLPDEARNRAEAVKAAVEESIGGMVESARRTAEETQAIDAAFQDRVRRNYDMLTDAVKLMGVVAGSGGQAAAAPSLGSLGGHSAAPPPRRREPPAEPPSAEQLGLRPRLRLTPTATDEEFRSVFETAGGRAPPEPAPEGEGGWPGKDLLSTIDGDSSDTEGQAERLVQEIEAMGIDPAALLPRGRIDEVAAAIQTRDQAGAREVVRRLAPAATRRLVRRLFSDAALRGQTERYLRRFVGMLDEAAERDRGGHLVASLLSSDAGRAYLLLDAAAGDLG
jgi:hypothetical protein